MVVVPQVSPNHLSLVEQAGHDDGARAVDVEGDEMAGLARKKGSFSFTRLTMPPTIRTITGDQYVARVPMNTKLTLSMDESVIECAKRAARARNTSVSAMLSGLVRGLDALDHPRGRDFVGPLTRAATGLVKLGTDRSDADLLAEALSERYGSRG